MSDKQTSSPFDFMNVFAAPWQVPNLSAWSFAEREDKLEERAFSNLQRINRTLWDQTEKALDDHMAFASKRLHEDFECAKTLTSCRMPDEVMGTLQAFYTRMAEDYQTHGRMQMEMLQAGFSEGLANAEELGEAALEAASELTKAAEETMQEPAVQLQTRRTPKASAA